MKRKMNWEVRPQVMALVTAIVARAVKESPLKIDRMSLAMDLIAAHNNGCPLRFDDLLTAEPFDFAHDIVGIQRHMNRQTGKLDNHFLPRFYDPIPAVTKKARGVAMLKNLLFVAMMLGALGCKGGLGSRISGPNNSHIEEKSVACCQDSDGTYPAAVPSSHAAFCDRLTVRNAQGGYGNVIDGVYYERATSDCGFGHGRIGDQYYTGWTH